MKVFSSLAAALRFVFGTVTYQPPGFAVLIGRGLRRTAAVLSEHYRRAGENRPRLRLVLTIALLLAAVLAAGLLLRSWLRPGPPLTQVTITVPPVPFVHEDAEPGPLVIEFDRSAAALEAVGGTVAGGIDLSPDMPGTWRWESDRLLVFKPDEAWPAGALYTVTFRKDLFAQHIKLEKYRHTFTSEPLSLQITELYFTIDKADPSRKQVTATVTFSHPVDPASFEDRVLLRPVDLDKEETAFEQRGYGVTFSYDKQGGTAYILSEPLPVPARDVTLELSMDRGVKSRTGGEAYPEKTVSRVAVPGISNYIRVESIHLDLVRNEEYVYQQLLLIDTRGEARTEEIAAFIDVFVLPEDRPAQPGRKAAADYYWSNPAEIGPEVLELAEPAELQARPSEREYTSLSSFGLKAEPGTFLYVRLKKGAPFYGGYRLAETFDTVIRVPDYPRQVEIMHDGMLLSSAGEKTISLMHQGLQGVQYRIGRIRPGQVSHLVSQSSGRLSDPQFDNYRFSEDNIVDNFWATRRLPSGQPGEPVYFSFDFSRYLADRAEGEPPRGLFFFEVRDWDPENNRTGYIVDKRLIFISDLGMLVKNSADGTHDIFVQSISSGLPAAGVKVEVLGKNGIPVLFSLTDAQGHVSLPSFEGYSREKTPVAYLASRGSDLSFLPVEGRGRWLDYSGFDTGGEWGTADPDRVEGYLFSERGIYRPGDTVHIGMIVKPGDWGTNLAGLPLEAAVMDPRGMEIHKEKLRVSESGFEEMSWQTERSSLTGTWQVNLYTLKDEYRSQMIGSTTLAVEEFLPDKMTIRSSFPDAGDAGWVSPEKLKAVVKLRNLFGSPAAGNRVQGEIILEPGVLRFRDYDRYTFTDPFTSDKRYREQLEDQVTDRTGSAAFELNLQRFDAAVYTLRFLAAGYEKGGGRSVSAESGLLVSPLTFLVGARPDGDLSYIHQGSSRSVEFIAVDPGLKQIDAGGIVFELNRIGYVSVLTKQPNGAYGYKSVEKRERLSLDERVIPAAGLRYALPADEPGDYELLVRNRDGLKLSAVRFTVAGQGNISRSLEKNAELKIRLNKTDFRPGEEIEVFIKAPYAGAGIITIERDKVYASRWFRGTAASFTEKIRIPESLEGNGYVTVSFIRAADSKEIYMSPLSYGAAPFSLSKKRRTNELHLNVPGTARSGDTFTIGYHADKPGRVLIFAVDEGILQAASYTSPDPLAFFFKKRALEVRTSQILDLILPDYSLVRSLAAMGGGMWEEEALSRNLNPFRRGDQPPVVYWSGIQNTGPGRRQLSFTLPDYFNGTLRVMAVVVSSNTAGSAEERSVVSSPFVISPAAPLFAAPGDSFGVAVTVTNLASGSGPRVPVTLSLSASDGLHLPYTASELFIDEGQDTTVTIPVIAGDSPGAASIRFTAQGAGEESSLQASMSIRPAVPYRTSLRTGIVKKHADHSLKTSRDLYPELRVLEASVSTLPVGLAAGLKNRLDEFPYGCSEQVVSQAVPYLYLGKTTGFGIADSSADEKIGYAVTVLRSRQTENGLTGVWAANSHTSDFVTAYGMHFLTACRSAGRAVPLPLFESGLNGLRIIARREGDSLRELRTSAYAIYLLTLNEQVTTNYIAALRERLDSRHPAWKKDITGAWLAASYAMMRQEREAGVLIRETAAADLDVESPWYFSDRFLQKAMLLYLLAEHFPVEMAGRAAPLIDDLAAFLQTAGGNTVQSAWTIMALAGYQKAAGPADSADARIRQVLTAGGQEELALPGGRFPAVSFSAEAERIEIENRGALPLYFQITEAGFDRALPEQPVSRGIEIFREYYNAPGKPVRSLRLGEEVTVRLRIRSLRDEPLPNIAIVDLLPAGLEAVPLHARESAAGSWQPDYVDLREDRLLLFGTAGIDAGEYVYKVRAVARGRFTVPPVFCESMYDTGVYGWSPREPLVVE